MLFQLDQPHLDFCLYRVMHAKSDEVLQFLDKVLLPMVQAASGQRKKADKAEVENELAMAVGAIVAMAFLDAREMLSVGRCEAGAVVRRVRAIGMEP